MENKTYKLIGSDQQNLGKKKPGEKKTTKKTHKPGKQINKVNTTSNQKKQAI